LCYHSQINLIDKFGSEYFASFCGGRSLLGCGRIRAKNDGAPDYNGNGVDHSHRIKPKADSGHMGA
jgi:hypothetical protein